MKLLILGTVGLIAAALAPASMAAIAGTVLFAQPGSQIIDAQGLQRPAKRGDVLSTAERLVTPPQGIAQIKLPDGSLVGLRPGSALRIDLPPQAAADAPQVISLQEGALRVIGSELMDAKKPSSVTLQSGQATLKLNGADLQSALVLPTDSKTEGAREAGSYNRLLVGAGSIASAGSMDRLAARETSFVGSTNLPTLTLAAAPAQLFAGSPLADRGGVASQPQASSLILAPVALNLNPGVVSNLSIVTNRLPLPMPAPLLPAPRPVVVLAEGKTTGTFVDAAIATSSLISVATITRSPTTAPVTSLTPTTTVTTSPVTTNLLTTNTLTTQTLTKTSVVTIPTKSSCRIGTLKLC